MRATCLRSASTLWLALVPLIAMPAGLYADDCDGNGIPDRCEIACGDPGGPCDLPGCGQQTDCDVNGAPDNCELQHLGRSLLFDGVDDIVRVPRNASMEPMQELTVEAWIHPDEPVGIANRILRIRGSGGTPGVTLAATYYGDPRIQFLVQLASQGSVTVQDNVPTATYYGQWTHVAAVYSRPDNYCRLYINGQLRGEDTAVGELRYGGLELNIGSGPDLATDTFRGAIDEVRIWRVARSQQQIIGAMRVALTGEEDGLGAMWRFSESDGQQVRDATPNHNNGTLGANADPAGDPRDPTRIEVDPSYTPDCNGNGVFDACDLLSGQSADCNGDGIPDECQTDPAIDCDANGVIDSCEIASGQATDCDANQIPDACQFSPQSDCNANQILDSCELADGTVEDCDANNTPDECQFTQQDCNSNHIVDTCEIASGTVDDCDANHVPDECQFTPQEDCNSNFVVDRCEIADGEAEDCNKNGRPDACDIAEGGSFDDDSDGVPDECAFHSPSDRARPCGRIFAVPDSSPTAIHVFDRHGASDAVLSSVAFSPRSVSLGFDVPGNLLLIDGYSSRIKAVSRTGSLAYSFDAGEETPFCGVAVSPGGGYAVCANGNRIKFFDENRAYVGQLTDHLNVPNCFAFNRAGELYVGNKGVFSSYIARFDADLQFVSAFGQFYLHFPLVDLVIAPNQSVYAATDDAIFRFDRDGGFLGILLADGLSPQAMAFDDLGFLWVVNSSAPNLYRFDSNDVLREVVGLDTGLEPSVPALSIAFDILPSSDCDADGVPDDCELLTNAGTDCNRNNVPDECELHSQNDCDGNGVLDECQPDCDNDGVPDVCEIANCLPGDSLCLDCNANGEPDGCEIITNLPSNAVRNPSNGHFYALSSGDGTGFSLEAQAVAMGGHLAAIADAAENAWLVATYAALTSAASVYIGFSDAAVEGQFAWTTGEPVSYTNWLPGEPNNSSNEDWTAVLIRPASSFQLGKWVDAMNATRGVFEFKGYLDCNDNGVIDTCDIGSGASLDCNHDGIPDECLPFPDCNANGIHDQCDVELATSADCNASGVPDECELSLNDCNGNLVPDDCEDCNGNGLADECDLASGAASDCNGNGISDDCEDCNGNSLADECDLATGTSADLNGNGIPDECDPDCNDNGTPDFTDLASGESIDCNTNGIPDECDIATGLAVDCNRSASPDECDIAFGWSSDCDRNSIPDECQPDTDHDGFPDACDRWGDADHDADVDLADYQVFFVCQSLGGPGVPPPFAACLDSFDGDHSGTVDLRDVRTFQRLMSGSH